MLQPVLLRLSMKILTLAVFIGCIFLFSTPERVLAVYPSCESCVSSFESNYTQCETAEQTCKDNCDATGGYGYGSIQDCKDACHQTRDQCIWNAGMTETDCLLNCVPGGSGGGGSQSRTRTPCMQDCYTARLQCIDNQGIPDAEDCINAGDDYWTCCHYAYNDCMSNCP
jgi:hypothetical protein